MALKQITFELLVETCLHDRGFFEDLKCNPAKTLKNKGLRATPDIIVALRKLDYDAIRNVALACNPVTGPLC